MTVPEPRTFDPSTDYRVFEIINVAIDELGGLGALTQHHQLGILPPLIEASYILVLHEEKGASADEIAERLGVPRGAVDSVFESPYTEAMPRIRYASSADQQFEPHVEPEWSGMPSTGHLDPEYLMGAAAKFAYSVVQRRGGGAPH
jgi:hypothetical protein